MYQPGRARLIGKQSQIMEWDLQFSGSQKLAMLLIRSLKTIWPDATNITSLSVFTNTPMQ